MHVDTHFLAYWRDLNAQLRLLGKNPARLGLAWAAYRHLPAALGAKYCPSSGAL